MRESRFLDTFANYNQIEAVEEKSAAPVATDTVFAQRFAKRFARRLNGFVAVYGATEPCTSAYFTGCKWVVWQDAKTNNMDISAQELQRCLPAEGVYAFRYIRQNLIVGQSRPFTIGVESGERKDASIDGLGTWLLRLQELRREVEQEEW